jgi:hypothetical protein
MAERKIARAIQEHLAATPELRGAHVVPRHLSTIYRLILIEVLSLSYAVRASMRFPDEPTEALAKP